MSARYPHLMSATARARVQREELAQLAAEKAAETETARAVSAIEFHTLHPETDQQKET